MTRRRYELTAHEWSIISPLLPNKPRGVARVDDRRVLNGILWRFRTGSPWAESSRTLHGPPTACYNRFVRWRKAGVWDRLFETVPKGLRWRHRHDRLDLCPRSPARGHRKKGWRRWWHGTFRNRCEHPTFPDGFGSRIVPLCHDFGRRNYGFGISRCRRRPHRIVLIDGHQHYAVSKDIDDEAAPRRVEVLLGKERRRRWALMRRRRSRRPALCLEQISLPLRANMA